MQPVRTSHPVQTPEWANFRQATGLLVANIGGWNVTFHKIPFTPWTIGYFPKGPLPDKKMIELLVSEGKKHNAIFIQVEPDIEATHSFPRHPKVKKSHHPLFTKYTYLLDLRKSEEDLLKAMHPKTRYNIKLAQKHGVTIREEKNIEVFLKLNKETLIRQGFYAHNDAYYQLMWKHLHPSIARLFTATYKKNILAAWIIFCSKDTIYYPYGASSREHRDVMAPSLLLWEIAKWGKVNGYKYFDLWGALGPKPDPNDPWFGFHRFKSGFTPSLIEFIGSFDVVISPLLYEFYKIADRIRWTYLRLKR